MGKQALKEYKKKRDFKKTSEPAPGKLNKNHKPLFVIQKHDASSLHYDFRIQIDGVLKSWAVPKGLSTDPREKRLAIRTEDHPIEYANFEGVIPEDEYGGGPVLIWDRGEFRNIKEEDKGDASLLKNLQEGHLTIWLEGEKLKGGYALIRTGKSDDDNWLIIKMDDKEADARRNPVSTAPESVLSGKTIDQIKE
jgi:DNA ligase D-like protein (predicted 3'-phosphoesterase)